MNNYYKYLPVSEVDKSWGLYVVNVGCTKIVEAQRYPPGDHPPHHYFNWEDGRIFDEFQLIYILNGEGVFESKSCPLTPVKPGTLLMLYPYEWHRFKPNSDTGWEEYWIGCKGNILQNIYDHHFFPKERPTYYLGTNEAVINLFTGVIEQTRSEKTGYQQLVSGMLLHLFGKIFSLSRQLNFDEKNRHEAVINRAMSVMHSNINSCLSFEKLAGEFFISYSLFRKAFKLYTGMSPHQYFLQLKLNKAKALLLSSGASVKQIAGELGFESAYSFSRIFKAKTGYSPNHFKKKFLQ
ncbi:AraC family transcriptional regulator [Niabella drilacis]|uniref:AraC-like ligand binding domain-containing protein n=1 Tax=Niabella drilacis (strain DSM 25811 / CCM 8410 / CCUG 62505 / LMG 26954 / E90) TaxID=1285928 RepID=A0A1G6ZG67_NIADE|nr:AraC family transcriptional regulator [Niabella drilacis]SDE00845.1 AraC-like ligand binding domain-containing protein [Niabella drilacis]